MSLHFLYKSSRNCSAYPEPLTEGNDFADGFITKMADIPDNAPDRKCFNNSFGDFKFSFYFMDSGVAKRIICSYLLFKSALCSGLKKNKPTVLSTSRRAIFALHVYIVYYFCHMYTD